jgi:hypothetical protein
MEGISSYKELEIKGKGCLVSFINQLNLRKPMSFDFKIGLVYQLFCFIKG